MTSTYLLKCPRYGFDIRKRGHYFRVDTVLPNCSFSNLQHGDVITFINSIPITTETTYEMFKRYLDNDIYTVQCTSYSVVTNIRSHSNTSETLENQTHDYGYPQVTKYTTFFICILSLKSFYN